MICFFIYKQDCKPGYVFQMIIYLEQLLPAASSNLPKTNGPHYRLASVLLQMGFTCAPSVTREAVVSYTALPPLPFPVRPGKAVHFCCTVPGVASARRYLAPCPLKPGLSSPASFRSCSSDHLSYSEPPYYTTIFFVCPYRRSGIFFYPFIPSGSFLR